MTFSRPPDWPWNYPVRPNKGTWSSQSNISSYTQPLHIFHLNSLLLSCWAAWTAYCPCPCLLLAWVLTLISHVMKTSNPPPGSTSILPTSHWFAVAVVMTNQHLSFCYISTNQNFWYLSSTPHLLITYVTSSVLVSVSAAFSPPLPCPSKTRQAHGGFFVKEPINLPTKNLAGTCWVLFESAHQDTRRSPLWAKWWVLS